MKARDPIAIDLQAQYPALFCDPTPEEEARMQAERESHARARATEQALRRRQTCASWGIPRKDIEALCTGTLRETPAIRIVTTFAADSAAELLILSGLVVEQDRATALPAGCPARANQPVQRAGHGAHRASESARAR